jgi:putative inorganic carbon (HCO3(-)) transporter
VIGLARLGGPVACLGLALLLVAGSRRDRLAGLGFAVFGGCLLAASMAPDKPAELAGGLAAALAIAVALAAVFRLVPWLFPAIVLACIPIRVGALGHQLLVPIYVAIGGAVVLLAWQLAHGDARVRELGRAAWPLAALVAWTGLSLAWSQDVHEGAIEVLAFYVPFTMLALVVARLPWSRLGARALYGEAALMAIIFAAVGFYQYNTRNVFENPKVINSNAYAAYFRVNSVFWDPSVYGRFLVVAMVPSIVLLARGRSVRLQLAAAAAVIVTWFGLLISFSQSSFAALLVATIAVAAVAWRWRALLAVALVGVVVAGIAISAPQIRRSIEHHTKSGLNSASSGRASLVANGIRIAASHPIVGVGVGGFKHAYAARVDHLKGKAPKTAASHDTPVTVAAETGVVGLGLFVWLVVAVLLPGYRRLDRRLVSRAALVAAVTLTAILVHSLFYNDFFEDPTTWLLIGLVALAASKGVKEAAA